MSLPKSRAFPRLKVLPILDNCSFQIGGVPSLRRGCKKLKRRLKKKNDEHQNSYTFGSIPNSSLQDSGKFTEPTTSTDRQEFLY